MNKNLSTLFDVIFMFSLLRMLFNYCGVSFSPLQFGTFRSPEGEYFVEPLHSYQGEHYEEEHTKPHIVYRKLSSRNHTSEETSACDTTGIPRSRISMHAPHFLQDKPPTRMHPCNHNLTASRSELNIAVILNFIHKC